MMTTLLIGGIIAALLAAKKKGVTGVGGILNVNYRVEDIKDTVYIYMMNERSLYDTMYWIISTLDKQAARAEKRGDVFVPSITYLSESSTVKKLCTDIIKLQGWQPARNEYALIREAIAQVIIDEYNEQKGY